MRDPVAQPLVEVSRVYARPDADVVDLFCRAFPAHPAARLGLRVAGALLSAFSENAAMFVARDRGGVLLGFLVGGETAALDGARVQFVRRHALRIAAAYLRAGGVRRLAADVAERFRAPAARPVRERNDFQLRLIAVSPAARRAGVGTLLLEAFEAMLPPQSSYHAWTLAGSTGAEAFYQSLGFDKDVSLGAHVRYSRAISG
jgi:GNAT superfamily N-acetyltransferase